jgi:hypothetical protein
MWQKWITPIHSDPDAAFRERTLRAAVLPWISAAVIEIVVILVAPNTPNGRAIIWGCILILNMLEGVLLHYG